MVLNFLKRNHSRGLDKRLVSNLISQIGLKLIGKKLG